MVKPLLANLEKYGDGLIVAADTSIWEERQKDKKHFAFSTAVAIVGLREFAEIAHRAGDDATRTDALNHVALLRKGFKAAFVRDAKLRGTLEEGIKNRPGRSIAGDHQLRPCLESRTRARHGGADGTSQGSLRWLSARSQHLHGSGHLQVSGAREQSRYL